VPLEIDPSVPFDGAPAIESVRASPSASEQVSGTGTAVAARVCRATLLQLGACVIEIVTVAGADSAVPSDALYVNVSCPEAPAFGV
jgi:hypothetical protein